MSARALRRQLPRAMAAVRAEIAGNAASGGTYARGLASEGYAGGYRDALDDVLSVLNGVTPGDRRNYWRERPE